MKKGIRLIARRIPLVNHKTSVQTKRIPFGLSPENFPKAGSVEIKKYQSVGEHRFQIQSNLNIRIL
jgi:hypothetical protein